MTTVLFTRKNSIYKKLGCDCWDIDRDARLYLGNGKVIAHPPCRAWGRFAHRSKHTDDEKQLALWTLNHIRAFGGIMEHPATSQVWRWLKPNDKTIVIDQLWFGHRAQKRTRLFYNKVGKPPLMPLEWGHTPTPERPVEFMSQAEREATPMRFAQYLLDWVNDRA